MPNKAFSASSLVVGKFTSDSVTVPADAMNRPPARAAAAAVGAVAAMRDSVADVEIVDLDTAGMTNRPGWPLASSVW